MAKDRETFEEELPCELNGTELDQRRDACAKIVGDIIDIEEEKRNSAAKFKASLDEKKKSLILAAKEIREGKAYRYVECENVADFTLDRMNTVRLDTGDIITHRTLRKDERQGTLRNIK